jgi:SAM-dependent methyltransferase
MSQTSVVVPFDHVPSQAEQAWLATVAQSAVVSQLVVAAPGARHELGPTATWVESTGGRGAQLKAALSHATGDWVVIQDADLGYSPLDYPALLGPLQTDRAEAVYGNRHSSPMARQSLAGKATSELMRVLVGAVTQLDLADPGSGVKAMQRAALVEMGLQSSDDGVDAEIAVKLASRHARIFEVPLPHSRPPAQGLGRALRGAKTLLSYALFSNDTDNQHEGYNTLLRMEGAPNYNSWLGRKFSPHLGKRVLEVGAGIGTITRQIEQGRELVVALEMDPFYVTKLKNLFARRPHVLPLQSGVEQADWDALRVHNLDTILLSNVLEHIADDAQAIGHFKRALVPGGKLVLLVPAIPQLFGTIDEAVGHYRRYTPTMLRRALESQGFTVEHLEWMNMVGIPGWLVNGRLLKRRAVPAVQLAMYDQLAPLLARAEAQFKLPVGMSLLCVARS